MDKVLKRRLVGATILIALAVIFVPMFLNVDDGELVDREVDMSLPERPDSGEDVRRIPLDPSAARRREPQADAATDDAGAPPESRAPSEPAPAGEAAPPDPAESPAIEGADADPDAGPDPDPDPGDTGGDGVETGSGEEARDAGDEPPAVAEEPPSETSQPVAADVPSAAEGGNWLVQVASFGSADTAREIAQRLESLGHPVLTDRITRGEVRLHRIRTGPYGSESAAEQAQAQIQATVAGVEPMVTSNGDAGQATATQSGLAVQAGVFTSRENADDLAGRLEGMDFDSYVVEDESAGRPVWRVRIGPEPDRAAAQALVSRLQETAGIEGLIVDHP